MLNNKYQLRGLVKFTEQVFMGAIISNFDTKSTISM